MSVGQVQARAFSDETAKDAPFYGGYFQIFITAQLMADGVPAATAKQ